MNRKQLEKQLASLPLLAYGFLEQGELDFTPRVRAVCAGECPMYGKTWACPPAVGSVERCRQRCLSYAGCLMLCTAGEAGDITDMAQTLATREAHEAITEQAGRFLRSQGAEIFILSCRSCTLCPSCEYEAGRPCRHPDKMHPCVESHGINLIPAMEKLGLAFSYGGNVVTWVSLIFYNDEEEHV